GRRVKARSNDRLTPSDLMKLVPGPFLVSDRSLAEYARRLDRRRERLQRLTARLAGKEFVTIPRQIHVPKLVQLESMANQIDALPTCRKCLKRAEFRIYMDALRQLRGTVAGLVRKVQNIGYRADEDRYLMKVGRLFLDAPPDVFGAFILIRAETRQAETY